MSDTEDNVNDFIGDKNDGEAVRWFGLYSLVVTAVSAFFIDTSPLSNTWVPAGGAWWWSNVYFHWPVFVAWMFLGFLDSEMMRMVFTTMVTMSVLGPFASHWKALIDMVYACDGSCLDNVSLYIWTAIYAFITFIQMIVDITLIPQVYSWSGEGEFGDDDAKSLFSVMF